MIAIGWNPTDFIECSQRIDEHSMVFEVGRRLIQVFSLSLRRRK